MNIIMNINIMLFIYMYIYCRTNEMTEKEKEVSKLSFANPSYYHNHTMISH